jgi:hypothetical protein
LNGLITWIYQSGDYETAAAEAFELDLTERYSALSVPRGFDFRVIGASHLTAQALGRPVLRHRGEDLLSRRQCFIVGDTGRSPQSMADMRVIYRTIAASDSVLLNRSFDGPDYLERDKLAIVHHAAGLGVPTLDTIAVPPGTGARRVVDDVRRGLGAGPYILKPRELSMGLGVLKVESEQHLLAALDMVAQSGFGYIVQPFLPHLGDMRVFVADGDIVTSLTRKPRSGGYLASISQGGSLEVTEDHLRVAAFCKSIAQSLDAEYMCIDWLMIDSGPVLNEWSTAHGGFTLLPEPQRTAVADAFFGWIARKFAQASA